ncbi:hypothetical protein RIVM261_075790 [Rivularia sp. IAM M-261]|nr:hypothetical protein RIVM261_075790 [Rivularia sp. IAM M-261]
MPKGVIKDERLRSSFEGAYGGRISDYLWWKYSNEFAQTGMEQSTRNVATFGKFKKLLPRKAFSKEDTKKWLAIVTKYADKKEFRGCEIKDIISLELGIELKKLAFYRLFYILGKPFKLAKKYSNEEFNFVTLLAMSK